MARPPLPEEVDWWMRSFIVIAAFALLSCLSWANGRPSGIPEEARYGKVDRVYDGDTLVLMGGSRARIIRLDGIDAPERDQPYGPVATAALEYMVGRAIYYVETDKNDQYETVVATLYHSKEGYNINASLVCAGLA
ncbi:MAG: thermonuclease family protein [Proteobacteria bacterium]|nr:thermonuclease family protein [Pseudomonadota bacterium]